MPVLKQQMHKVYSGEHMCVFTLEHATSEHMIVHLAPEGWGKGLPCDTVMLPPNELPMLIKGTQWGDPSE